MTMNRSPILVLVFGILVLAFGIQAHAKEPSIYRYHGLGAGAYYSGVDATGCIYTYIFVEFGEATEGNPPNPTQQPTLAYMYIIQWDQCTGEYKSAQTNPPQVLPEGAVHVDPSLKSASLNATIALLDDAGSTFTANVSITWTAIGPFQRSNRHDHSETNWGVVDAKTRSLSRDATVSGSVMVEGVNLTPSQWTEQAWIEQEIRGSITILNRH